jgi:predicted dehydrogenase
MQKLNRDKSKAVFGLIGTGGIAQSQHLPNLTRSSHIELKVLCDLDEGRVKQMQQKYKIPHSTTDYHAVLSDPEIMAVVIATREDAQADLAIEAMNAGKHVYVEKPLADTPEKCALVSAAQKRSGKFAAVGFNRRFAPAYRRAKEIITACGGAKNISYRIADDYWRWSKQYNFAPGTRVIHEVCHIFDILRWFTGSDAESVYCIESRADDEIIVMKMKSGCVVSITDSGYVDWDLPKERLEVICEKGTVTVDDFVELRTFGVHGFPPVERYCGHTHPDREFTHKFLLDKIGLEGWLAIRRMRWELNERYNALKPEDDFPEREELEIFQKQRCPGINYMVDKGWFQAVDHFAQCVLANRVPDNATAEDGLKASSLSNAAIRSRTNNEIIRI